MINYIAFSKTMLKIFNCIDLFTDRIDKAVENLAVGGSGAMFGNSLPVITLFNKITDLTSKKELLINLRLHTVDTLKQMDEDTRKILILKYKERFTAEHLAQIFKISLRTYFRKHDRAVVTFASLLKQSLLNENEIVECLQSEKWINETYLTFCEKATDSKTSKTNLEFSSTLLLDKLIDLKLANNKNSLIKSY